MKIIKNAKIKDYTTYKLSGNIPLIVFPKNVDELSECLSSFDNCKVIGNGSNLIISESFKGTIIKLSEFNSVVICDDMIRVGAGYSLMKLCRLCAKNGLSGLEFACGIPGTIGGAIYMNAGAYGMAISDVLNSVTVLDDNLSIKKIDASFLQFGYRDSVFKKKKYICLEAEFALSRKDSDKILEDIKDKMSRRRVSQPLEYPSAGSVFKNDFKPAGLLIEEAGLKGYRVGDAQVSEKHANFIVNRGNASAEDVICLIDTIKKKVKDKYGVDLVLEQEILKG